MCGGWQDLEVVVVAARLVSLSWKYVILRLDWVIYVGNVIVELNWDDIYLIAYLF